MARRKTTRKKTTTRRRTKRGMGAINVQNTLMNIAGTMAGVAIAGYVSKMLPASIDDKIKIAIPIGVGAFLPMVMKSDLGKNIGLGMISYGGSKLLTSFGIGAMEEDTFQISGDDLSVVAGDEYAMAGDEYAMAGDDEEVFSMAGDDISVLAGFDEQ